MAKNILEQCGEPQLKFTYQMTNSYLRTFGCEKLRIPAALNITEDVPSAAGFDSVSIINY